MAATLTTFEPTRATRVLGLFGAVGAILLLSAYVSFEPFEDARANEVRLVGFSLAGVAISLAFYRRQAVVAPTLAILTTGGVAIAGLWYAAMVIVAPGIEHPFIGAFGLLNLFANIALWVTPTIWAIGMLHTGAAWQDVSRSRARLTKLGIAILLGSIVAWLGDDRLGLVDSLWGQMWQTIALAGVAMNGIGWLILGTVLVVADRGAPSASRADR